MGRELQKRKRRSSRAKVTMPTIRKKVLNPSGNGIIARNWDKKATLSQNYTRFGLVAKLGAPPSSSSSSSTPLSHTPTDRGLLSINEVKVERDPATGRILKVLSDPNPLGDPLNDIPSSSETSDIEDDGEEWAGLEDGRKKRKPIVVQELEREAARPTEPKKRHQSEREVEWLRDLVGRHGEDVEGMARDRKLNPMQQTAADIRRRLRKAGLLS
ncbi:nucleolar protein 16 [Echria macrotheca]|uniref:Nucleolar protein 16 n=1 Tax=Echria macrotheca TaxID=438768 RepID=A0AAJ0BRG5_9PEZI|nr:nucleolar protein 16 [Echria macrotheca]